MTTKRSTNGSTPSKIVSISSKTNALDPLDEAEKHLAAADKATGLLEYSEDFDEPTGRTEVTVNLQQPSQPDIEGKSEPPQAKVAVSFIKAVRGWPQMFAALGLFALAAWVAWLKWGR